MRSRLLLFALCCLFALPLTQCVVQNCAKTLCGWACVDLQTSSDHCGVCGVSCQAGKSCVQGICQRVCLGGETLCGETCRDLQSDASHCGTCGKSCNKGESCVSGACQLVCPGTQAACGGKCIDLQSDATNCGTCGVVCESGQQCKAGACQGECPAGQLLCDGSCVEVAKSSDHCGACGTKCSDEQFCVNGTCLSSCEDKTGNKRLCDGACVNIQTDISHCGQCGNACQVGEICKDGACFGEGVKCDATDDCPSGFVCQNDKCVQSSTTKNAKLFILQSPHVMLAGQSATLTAIGLDAGGHRVAPGDIRWKSSVPGVVSTSGGGASCTVRAGSTEGVATITAMTDEGVQATVSIRVLKRVGNSRTVRVTVIDQDGTAIPGAVVRFGTREASTDARGVATATASPPFDLHVFHREHSYFSAPGATGNDFLVTLQQQPSRPVSGGTKGSIDFSALPNKDVVGFGYAGFSLPLSSLADATLPSLFGGLVKASIFGQPVLLPSGSLLSFSGAGKMAFQAVTMPGTRQMWAFGGRYTSSELIGLTQSVSGNYSVSKFVSLFGGVYERFAWGTKSPGDVPSFPQVTDSKDTNGNGSTADLIPDFDSFPTQNIALSARSNRVLSVLFETLPSVSTGGKKKTYNTTCMVGVVQPGSQWLPLGLGAAQSGSLKCSVSFSDVGFAKTDKMVVVVWATLDDATGKDVSRRAMVIRVIPMTQKTLRLSTFPSVSTSATFDVSKRTLNRFTVNGASLYQLTMTATNGQQWIVWPSNRTTSVSLPSPPSGMTNRVTTSSQVHIRSIRLQGNMSYTSLIRLGNAAAGKLYERMDSSHEWRIRP